MIDAPKNISFRFLPPTTLPENDLYKLAIFEILIPGEDKPILEYGMTQWDGKEWGVPDSPMDGCVLSLYAWAETVDPLYVAPKIISLQN